MKDLTDWDRVSREVEEGIEPANDTDFDDVEWDWSKAVLVVPRPKQPVSLRVDQDVLDFFKSEGRGYQTRMNAVLRAYMEAKKTG